MSTETTVKELTTGTSLTIVPMLTTIATEVAREITVKEPSIGITLTPVATVTTVTTEVAAETTAKEVTTPTPPTQAE